MTDPIALWWPVANVGPAEFGIPPALSTSSCGELTMESIGQAPLSVAPDTAPALAPARTAWVDFSRGSAMLLVITGHALLKTKAANEMEARWIHSFHLPLFFFISGMLIMDNSRHIPWPRMVTRCLTFSSSFLSSRRCSLGFHPSQVARVV